MAFIKEVWLEYFSNSLFSQILVVIVALLVLIFIYLLIKKLVPIIKKKKKDAEKKEITHIKQRERKIMGKLKGDKVDVERKIEHLKGNNSKGKIKKGKRKR